MLSETYFAWRHRRDNGPPHGTHASVEAQLGDGVLRLRLPRAGAAWTVGALLSLSGCLMQVLLRNPLADPYILGVSGGASFAALFGMTIGVAAGLLPALAWAGALVSIMIVFSLARGEGPWSGTRLLLTGGYRYTVQEKQGEPSTSTSFSFTNVDRGTHTLAVAVVDGDGKELIRSATTTFHMLRAAVGAPVPAPRSP